MNVGVKNIHSLTKTNNIFRNESLNVKGSFSSKKTVISQQTIRRLT